MRVDVQTIRNPHQNFQEELTIKLGSESISHFLESLDSIRSGSEFSIYFRDNSQESDWTVIWKLKGTDNRILLAHPDENEWIATVMIQESVLDLMNDFLEKGNEFSFAENCTLHRLSNLNLKVCV